MAEEPQPGNIQEGADDAPADLPTSAEGRKEAAALSSLEQRHDDDDDAAGAGAAARSKNVDTEALGKAMQNLDRGGGVGGAGAGAGAGDRTASSSAGAGAGAAAKKVKVDAADVGLLVDQLELSKVKATELLKAHDGDAVRAMTAFVTAAP
ncbi:hypothetical protein BDY21DRAFT_374157 [Lineolata rhizophorae]|uniref:Nascent polypeptide-associated complex subunit alpha-like UBA domain-containing protein n=1 Tax=Lineolata rhizophorae TaxID=578093 RepID=A0A6A6NS29_9PEZI|nr:hypothetical protein BDY21DRAFT_374157 [Lineolata rhizophorae]